MGDAAAEILSREARYNTGNCYFDAAALIESGRTGLSEYGGGTNPIPDMFLGRAVDRRTGFGEPRGAGERGRRLGSGFDRGAADTAHLE